MRVYTITCDSCGAVIEEPTLQWVFTTNTGDRLDFCIDCIGRIVGDVKPSGVVAE